MVEFPESEYYLIKFFHKLPCPFFIWPILILIINFLASYKTNIGFLADAETITFYISNSSFAIIALFLIIILYEKNMKDIKEWIEEMDLLSKKSGVCNNLNKIHKYFFGRYQFLVIISGILLRLGFAYFLLPEMALLGNIVNDTILMFLIFSLIFTSLGVILCIYSAGSSGIKVKYGFEVRNMYTNLVSLSVRNIVSIGLYLGFYCSAIILWAYENNQYAVGVLINLLIISGIFFVFIIEIAGIRKGLAMSKQNMLSEIKIEMENIEPLYESLRDSSDKNSYPKFYGIILTRENLYRKCKDIEEINEWIFNPESIIKISLTSIATLIIPIIRIIINV